MMKNIFQFLSIFFFLFLLGVLIGIRHQSNDDLDMILISKGCELFNPSIFIYYSSKVLGWTYKVLYLNYPQIEWYNFIYVCLISLSFSKIFFLILKYYKQKIFLLLFFFLLYFWLYLGLFLTNVQFTIAGGVLTGNAFLGIILLYQKEKKIYLHIFLISLIELLFGSFYRFEMFELLAIFFVFIFIAINVLEKKSTELKNYFIISTLIFIPLVVNKVEVLRLNQKEINFSNLNKAKGQFGDYLIMQKISNRNKLLNDVGWKQEDLDIIRTWSYPDFKKYSEPVLSYITKNADKSKIYSLNYFLKNIRIYINDTIYINNNFINLFIILIFCGFIAFSKNIWKYIILLLLLYLSINLFFSYFFKSPFQNVTYPIFSFIFLFVIIQTLENCNIIKTNLFSYFLIFLFFIITIQNFRIKSNTELTEYKKIKLLDDEIISRGVQEVYALPMTYKGSYHYRGILSLNEQKIKVFYCGVFAFHPNNTAFKNYWERDVFFKKMEYGVNFYFPIEQSELMNLFNKTLKHVIIRDFSIKVNSNIIKLNKSNGFLLQLKTLN